MRALIKTCVICKHPIGVDRNGWDGGHNAEPVTEGRCCEECNWNHVVPARFRQMRHRNKRMSQIG